MSANGGNPGDVAAVIVAAGRSSRFESASGAPRKPLVELGGRTLLELACASFAASARVAEIVLVAHPDDQARVRALAERSPALAKVRAVVAGGRERCDSVRQGVRATSARLALVAVHDAARPLVGRALVEAVCAAAAAGGAALAALALCDTVKESSDGRHAERTLDRSRLWAAQTPQVFERARFLALLEEAEREGWQPTDDAALWERQVGPVVLVPGEARNIKVTTREDLELAQCLLAERTPLAGRSR